MAKVNNCHSNGGVFNLGHRHPRVIEALRSALETLDIGNHHFVSAQRAKLTARLAELSPGELSYVVFGVGGGEAMDTAIKIARKATGRRKIISANLGYHGHTGLALAAGDAKFSTPFLSQSDDFLKIPFNNLEALEQALDTEVAAVVLETIPAIAGMLIPDAGYLPGVQAYLPCRLCDRGSDCHAMAGGLVCPLSPSTVFRFAFWPFPVHVALVESNGWVS